MSVCSSHAPRFDKAKLSAAAAKRRRAAASASAPAEAEPQAAPTAAAAAASTASRPAPPPPPPPPVLPDMSPVALPSFPLPTGLTLTPLSYDTPSSSIPSAPTIPTDTSLLDTIPPF